MVESPRAPVLLVSSEGELVDASRVWGTGGWVRPEQREALDWLTLARLLGWGVRVARSVSEVDAAKAAGCARWVIVAGEPDRLGEGFISLIASWLTTEPLLVVARAGGHGAFARLAGATHARGQLEGRQLRWTGAGPERRWECRERLQIDALTIPDGAVVAATLDEVPCIVTRSQGRGVIATLGFHPSRARDADGAATALLKCLLVCGSPAPVACLDLEGTMILRMDDPGGAQNVHYRNWLYPKLQAPDWAAIGVDLKRRGARMSIGYVPGWVDDGDSARGELRVAGRDVPRIPGAVHESPLVTYAESAAHGDGVRHDYGSEFRGIEALRAAGVADVELHGYTHMHPDTRAWAEAPDRYDRISWFRELGHPSRCSSSDPLSEHPLVRGAAALRRQFGVAPTTLIPPGDEWTDESLDVALDLGFQFVASYYLALRDSDRFCWATHVCAPYLDQPDGTWFSSGLPVVGYFHDREPATAGITWIGEWLDRWQAAGARRFMDFREVAAAVGRRLHLEPSDGALRLSIASDGAPRLVRPLPVSIWLPHGPVPASLTLWHEEEDSVATFPLRGTADGRLLSLSIPLPRGSQGRASSAPTSW